MPEFVPLSVTDFLEPAFIVIGLLAAGALVIILLEVAFLLVCRVGSRVADKLHERHARP
ncbi:MAG: hypothetical protein JSW46_06870 [Gemmatimonadota bacterium]|nr:MAG: hypothetical protein JSW46_06870 [Gemmatimonadota bacterium]